MLKYIFDFFFSPKFQHLYTLWSPHNGVNDCIITPQRAQRARRRPPWERRPLCTVFVSILGQWQLSVVWLCEFKRHSTDRQTERDVRVSSGPLCQCRTNILLCLNTHGRVPTLGSGTPRRSCDEFKANRMVLLVHFPAVHYSVEPLSGCSCLKSHSLTLHRCDNAYFLHWHLCLFWTANGKGDSEFDNW